MSCFSGKADSGDGRRAYLSKNKDDDYVIALCIDGKHYSTSAWKKRMERVFSTVSSDVVFVIGGSLGLADKVVRRANEKLSFQH